MFTFIAMFRELYDHNGEDLNADRFSIEHGDLHGLSEDYSAEEVCFSDFIILLLNFKLLQFYFYFHSRIFIYIIKKNNS